MCESCQHYINYGKQEACLTCETETGFSNYKPFKMVDLPELVKSLQLIQGMAGNPDASEGCRLIIKETQRLIDSFS